MKKRRECIKFWRAVSFSLSLSFSLLNRAGRRLEGKEGGTQPESTCPNLFSAFWKPRIKSTFQYIVSLNHSFNVISISSQPFFTSFLKHAFTHTLPTYAMQSSWKLCMYIILPIAKTSTYSTHLHTFIILKAGDNDKSTKERRKLI